MSISVTHLESTEQIADAFFVRTEVFQKEQGIDASHEFDGLDVTAEQFVAYDDGQPVGTARYRVLEDGTAKVERVAVLCSQRGKKIGQAIMEVLHETARYQQLQKLVLNSQLSAADFYENLGYTQVGEVFDEVGIPHIKMELSLDD